MRISLHFVHLTTKLPEGKPGLAGVVEDVVVGGSAASLAINYPLVSLAPGAQPQNFVDQKELDLRVFRQYRQI